jgi:hypothetical protein
MQNNCTTSNRLKRFVFQPCRLMLVVNVKKKHTQCIYATLYGYETVTRWAIILHTPVFQCYKIILNVLSISSTKKRVPSTERIIFITHLIKPLQPKTAITDDLAIHRQIQINLIYTSMHAARTYKLHKQILIKVNTYMKTMYKHDFVIHTDIIHERALIHAYICI